MCNRLIIIFLNIYIDKLLGLGKAYGTSNCFELVKINNYETESRILYIPNKLRREAQDNRL